MPITVAWTPSALPTPPGLFLDASLGVGVVSGGLVSAWGNQGALGGDFSSASSVYRPTLVSDQLPVPGNVIRFEGGKSLLGPSSVSNLLRNVGYGWMLVLIKRIGTDASPTSRRVLLVTTSSSSAARAAVYWDDAVGSSANRIALGARREDGESYKRVQSAVTHGPGEWQLVVGEFRYATNTLRLHRNGALDSENTSAFSSAGNTSDTSTNQWTIGGSATGTSSWQGDMALALTGAGLLTDDQREKLEGWAAHRYGLTDSLPETHPYKLLTPEMGPTLALGGRKLAVLDAIRGADTVRVNVKRYVDSETQLPQRARVSLMRMRDKRVFRRAWSEDGFVVFSGVDTVRERYIAFAEYPTNPDNPAAENYLRPVAGVSKRWGEIP